MVKKFYSKCDPELLLHMVHSMDDGDDKRLDLSDPKEFLQVAVLRLDDMKTFLPHRHVFKAGEPTVIAQESWVVIRGSVTVTFYDVDGSVVGNALLNPGDCSITFQGGHTYTVMESDTFVYEFKTGPYKGQVVDKVFI